MRNRIILFTITILTLIPGIGMSQEITWVKYPTNLDLGTEDQVSHPSVVFDGSKYHLWYVSQSGAQRSINYARSTDGITYEVYPGNPVLQDGVGEVWDREWVSQPSVVYDGTTFRMWYAGYDGNALRIGYATSADGVSWNKDAANPVLDVGASGDFDDEGVSSPGVLHDGDQYHIFYSGYDGANLRIGYATSADGVMWDKSASNPVLDLGPGDDFDNAGVSSPTVLHDETQYHIFYSGYDGANLRIGYATSPDGVSWNKNTSNPVLDLGPGGDWDDEGVSGPSVLYDGTLYRMFYSGYDGDNLKIGYAIGQGVQDLVANAGADDTICSGTCATLNGSASGGSGGYTYLWTPGNMTGQYPEVCPTTTTIYTLTVTDNNGCTAADQVVVTVRECDTTTCSVIANAASDVSICSGTCAALNSSASGGSPPYSYSWIPTTGLSNPNIADPEACPDTTTTYALTVTDDNGCTAADQVVVTVYTCLAVAISITPQDLNMYVDEAADYLVIATDSHGNSWDVTGGTTFATTGGGTFTDNRFKAGAAGTFTITATYLDLTTTTTVNIKSHGEAVGLSLHLSPDTITADGAVTCAVYGTDINGISWNATSEVTIFSTQDPKGTFANNIYYPGQVGEWAITAEMGTLRATAAVSVSHGAVVYLEIAPDSVSLTADDQQEYRGTAIDNDGNQWDATEEITWSEDDPIGAMAANVYYPGQAGTWTITATYTTVIDTSTVEVASGAFVDLSISAPTAITTHTTFTLTVSLYDGHDNPYSGDVAMTNSTKSITPDKIILTSGTWTGQAVITQSPVGGVDTITVSHNSVKAAAAMTVFLNSELGGTVTDEGAAIEFDPGDLGTTNVTVHIDTSTLLPEPLPGAIRFAGIVYDIELIDEQGNKIGTQTGQIGTVVVYLSYPDANNDGWVDGTWIREEDLIIYQFEKGTWIPLPTNVDQAENVAWAYVEHFSIFTLGGIETIPYADNIDSIHVYPNPYVPYDDDSDNGIPYDGSPNSGITFEELTENARIRIFKLAGNLVREESGRRTCPYCRRETKRGGVNPR